jgi:hypothetical protein
LDNIQFIRVELVLIFGYGIDLLHVGKRRTRPAFGNTPHEPRAQ